MTYLNTYIDTDPFILYRGLPANEAKEKPRTSKNVGGLHREVLCYQIRLRWQHLMVNADCFAENSVDIGHLVASGFPVH
jgi:hypothetical protein